MGKTVKRRKTTKAKSSLRKSSAPASKGNKNLLKYAALAAGAYLVINEVNKPAQAVVPNALAPLSPQAGLVPSTMPDKIVAPSVRQNTTLPLTAGSRGEAVKTLQRTLLSKGGAAANFIRQTSMVSNGTDVDGIFGQGTKNALFAAGRTYPVYDLTW